METKVITEKEELIQQYTSFTKQILKALTEHRVEDIPPYLQERENCINKANDIDSKAGIIVMSTSIHKMLTELLPIEQQIQTLLLQAMEVQKKRVYNIRNEKFLSKQYEQTVIVPNGAFYDKKN